MYQIYSTYTEYSAEYAAHPHGRNWPVPYRTYNGAWRAVESYLLARRWHRPAPGFLAPYGQTIPTALRGDQIIYNDAETIFIT